MHKVSLLFKNYRYFLLLLLVCLSSCFGNNGKKLASLQNLEIPSEKEFLKDYNRVSSKETLSLYKKPYTIQVYNKLIDKSNTYFPIKNDIFNIMNAPFLVKKEKNSELWQYRASTCVVSFVWNASEAQRLENAVEIYSYDYNMKKVNYQDCITIYTKENNIL